MTSEKVVNEVEQGLKEVQAKARDFAEQRRAVADEQDAEYSKFLDQSQGENSRAFIIPFHRSVCEKHNFTRSLHPICVCLCSCVFSPSAEVKALEKSILDTTEHRGVRTQRECLF